MRIAEHLFTKHPTADNLVSLNDKRLVFKKSINIAKNVTITMTLKNVENHQSHYINLLIVSCVKINKIFYPIHPLSSYQMTFFIFYK